MISNQIIQNCIFELRSITKVEMAVYDPEGTELIRTENAPTTEKEFVVSFLDSLADSQVINGKHFFKVYDQNEPIYVLVAAGSGEDVYTFGRIAVSQLQTLAVAYKERFDRNSFFQNLILDNLLLIDIYNRAKKLHIEDQEKRVVYLIDIKKDQDNLAKEVLRSIFTENSGDFVTAVEEGSLVLIKSLANDDEDSLEDIAKTIVDTLNTEAMLNVKVSYGTVAGELRGVSKSYKEAAMALEVGKIFYEEEIYVGYNKLGIGRLIYQLPDNLCKIFMDEIFAGDIFEELDDEMLFTIQKFFENSLNVSETSRQLYIHRNTLVYRIEKLEKLTGLDIRNFDDALTFKIALMVMQYMNHMKR